MSAEAPPKAPERADPGPTVKRPSVEGVKRPSVGGLSGLHTKAEFALAKTSSAISIAFPRIGDLPFSTFVSFAITLFVFTAFTDALLLIVSMRARELDHVSFPPWVEALNGVWMGVQILLLADLTYVFFRYYRPRPKDSSKPKIGESQVRQPKMWYFCTRFIKATMNPRSYLLLLAILLPMNALLFYNGIGRPVFTPSRLAMYNNTYTFNVTELVQPGVWPRGGGLEVDRYTWEVFRLVNNVSVSFDPRMLISSKECYSYSTDEFKLLGRLRGGADGEAEEFPKQAYCEALVGTMMAGSFGEPPPPSERTWQHDEDTWDEAFEFAVRLFSALAGIVADQSEGKNTMISMVGFSFLKDMTDVFDMFMLTFADVDQMHEGRPQLTVNYGLENYDWSFHDIIFAFIWVGMIFVLLRALAVIGFTPVVYIFQCCGSRFTAAELRRPIDAFFSMMFIELPFLTLRYIAWRHYGVPVSVMAVKNVLGIYEDLYVLGLVHGFGEGEKPRGFRLCCATREELEEMEGSA